MSSVPEELAGYSRERVQAALEQMAENMGVLVTPANAIRQQDVSEAHVRVSTQPPVAQEEDFPGPIASQLAGVTDQQLGYWNRIGLVAPSIPGRSGLDMYSFHDVVLLKVAKRLLDTGVPLDSARAAVNHVAHRNLDDLTGVFLFSDGETVFECTSADEILEVLQSGKGLYGLAIGGTIKEVRESARSIGESLSATQVSRTAPPVNPATPADTSSRLKERRTSSRHREPRTL